MRAELTVRYNELSCRRARVSETIETKRVELPGLLNERDDTVKALRELVVPARAAFKATYSPDSTQYEQAGGTPALANANLPAEKRRRKPTRTDHTKYQIYNMKLNISKILKALLLAVGLVSTALYSFGQTSTVRSYLLLTDGTLWMKNGDDAQPAFVDANVKAFQPTSGGTVVYVLGTDGNLWRERGNYGDRDWVDGNVKSFQAIDNLIVYVLSTDAAGTLWRERGTMNDRDWVDANVASFQAIDSSLIYVLGTDSNLWRERGTMNDRDWVDGNVASFQAIDSSLVYVLGLGDGTLWRERGTMNDRDWVDANVASFQAIDSSLVYVLGLGDGTLWRERGTMYDRDWVDASVTSFQSMDASLVYVLGSDGNLWQEQGNSSNRSLVSGSVQSFKVQVQVNWAPLPNIMVAGLNSGSTVQTGTQITVHYAATDADGNLSGIRYNIWNSTTGYFDNGGGGFVSQSGSSGDVIKTFTLDTAGVWYVWTDAQDANGAYSSTGAWSSGLAINVVTIVPLAVQFSSLSATTIGVGQNVDCYLTGAGTGLSEIGLDLCLADGTFVSNVGQSQSTWFRDEFKWMATASGTFYLRGYALNKTTGQKVYTSLLPITVKAPVVATKYIGDSGNMGYNANDSAVLVGGQTIKYDSVTGYVLEARLDNQFDQYLNYGPGRSTLFLKNSMMRFSSGYVSDGYMNNAGSSVLLYFGPDRGTSFQPCSHIKFAGGYVADGYMNNTGDSVMLPYGPGRSTSFFAASHIKFADGYVSDGYMKNYGSTVALPYGPGRSTDFGANSHVRFSGGYVSDGYLSGSGSSVTLNYGSSRTASFLPQCHVTFADGYVKTGYLLPGTDNYEYGPSRYVSINDSPVVQIDMYDKAAVANIVGRGNAAWTAIAKALFLDPFNSDGSVTVDETTIDNEIKQSIEILDAAVDALGNLPAIYSDYNNLSGKYTVHIQYPPIAFTPGSDGAGYITLGKVTQACDLQAKDGTKSVPAGKVCVFIDGYYAP